MKDPYATPKNQTQNQLGKASPGALCTLSVSGCRDSPGPALVTKVQVIIGLTCTEGPNELGHEGW